MLSGPGTIAPLEGRPSCCLHRTGSGPRGLGAEGAEGGRWGLRGAAGSSRGRLGAGSTAEKVRRE